MTDSYLDGIGLCRWPMTYVMAYAYASLDGLYISMTYAYLDGVGWGGV